jgi:hypothetical protein
MDRKSSRIRPSDHPSEGHGRSGGLFIRASLGRYNRPWNVSNRARGERWVSREKSARDGVWPDVGCSARLCVLANCGGRFLREPVRSPLRPRHPCALVNTIQCRRDLVRRVVSSSGTTLTEVPERRRSESPKQGIPQSEFTRSMPRDFVLLSSDLRDITDCPLDCQPDW